MDLDGKEVGGTGGSRWGEIIIMICYVRKESIFNEKKIEKKKISSQSNKHLTY